MSVMLLRFILYIRFINIYNVLYFQRKKREKVENGKTGGLDPFSENNDDVERIARKFEQKYVSLQGFCSVLINYLKNMLIQLTVWWRTINMKSYHSYLSCSCHKKRLRGLTMQGHRTAKGSQP